MSRAAVRTAGPDTGLLSPVRAGTPVEAAVADGSWVQAMLDAEAALARAQARCGTVPAAAAAAITAARLQPAVAELLDRTCLEAIGAVRTGAFLLVQTDGFGAQAEQRGGAWQTS